MVIHISPPAYYYGVHRLLRSLVGGLRPPDGGVHIMSTPFSRFPVDAEALSHRQREQTPRAFAIELVAAVRAVYRCTTVAALWVRRDSVYKTLPDMECYDLTRDAYTYNGPWPVICHPPCGPWGRYHHISKQDASAGLLALELADWYGGVVEQPASSRLFRGGVPLKQFEWGHPAEKSTRLYWGCGQLAAYLVG